MNFLPTSPRSSARDGSSLMVVLLIMFLVSFVATSLLTLGNHEKDMTFRRVSDIEARHVAESALELAIATLENHFAGVQSVTADSPDLQLSAAQKALLLGNARHVRDVRIVEVNNRLLRQRVYVDVYDPTTLLDPHRGTHVNVSEWEVIAEVDVDYRGQTRQVRAAQRFQVRESPFFTHAILYNMDLEFHPGPAMVINGPVHSNGRIWAVAQNSLHFLDRVSATQGIHVGGMMQGQQVNWASGYLNNQDGGRVWFNTNGRRPSRATINTAHSRVFANLYDGGGNVRSAGSYFDARSEESGKLFADLGFSNMSEYLANWYDGNVAMGSAEAPVIRPQFIPAYVADDGFGNRLNHGYALIEPLLPPLVGGAPNPFHKGEGEREKYSFKSGLSFEIRHLPGVDPASTPEHWRRLWEPGATPLPREGQTPSPAPVVHETFTTLSTGNLHNQGGFRVETGTTTYTVANGGLSYDQGEVTHTESTRHIRIAMQGNNRAFLSFPRRTASSVYFSYLVQMQSNGTNNHFQFGVTDGSDFSSIPGVRTEVNRSGSGIVAQVGSNTDSATGRTSSASVGNAVQNITYLVVGHLSKTDPNGPYDRAEFILNPSTLDRPGSGWLAAEFNTGITGVDTLFFRANPQTASAVGFHLSDIRVGSSYRDVVGGIRPEMAGATDYWMIPQKVRRSDAHNLDTTDFSSSPQIPLLNEEGEPLLDEYDQPVTQTILSTVHDPVYISEDVFHEVFRARIYQESGGVPIANGGLYDMRDLKPQDLVTIDMDRFRTEIIETEDTDRFTMPLPSGGSVLTYTPSREFNGVSYFQFPVEDEGRADRTVTAVDRFRPFTTAAFSGQLARNDYTSLSLMIENASRIPNPAYNANRSPGFTLATNSRLYVKGHYNADGVQTTGSSSSGGGEPEGFNALAALAADSITFLSNSFNFEESKNGTRPNAVFTEVNAALMSGIMPTNSADFDARYRPRHDYPISGGSHNYHRFLENWGGVRFRYRGSMVAFYESELARSPQEQLNATNNSQRNWYGAPIREYGFYDVFGTGAQPPGTPMARTFFKLDFRFVQAQNP